MSNERNVNNIDWKIFMYELDEEDEGLSNHDTVYATDGFDKYGYGEIFVIADENDSEYIGMLINTFGLMFVSGETFEPEKTHCLDNDSGETEYKFNIIYNTYDGEKYIHLMPVEIH